MQIELNYRNFKLSYEGFQRIGKNGKTYTSYFIGNVAGISRRCYSSYEERYAVMCKSEYRHGVIEIITGDGSIFQFPVKKNGKYDLKIIEVDRKVIYDLLDNEENLELIKVVEG